MKAGSGISAGARTSPLKLTPREKAGLLSRAVKHGKSSGARFKTVSSIKLGFEQLLLKCMKKLNMRAMSKAMSKLEEKVQNDTFEVLNEALNKGNTKTIKWVASTVKAGEADKLSKMIERVIVADYQTQGAGTPKLSGNKMKVFLDGLKFEGIGQTKFQARDGSLTAKAFNLLMPMMLNDMSATEGAKLMRAGVLNKAQVKLVQDELKPGLMKDLNTHLGNSLFARNEGLSKESKDRRDAVIDLMLNLGMNMGEIAKEMLAKDGSKTGAMKAFMMFEAMDRPLSGGYRSDVFRRAQDKSLETLKGISKEDTDRIILAHKSFRDNPRLLKILLKIENHVDVIPRLKEDSILGQMVEKYK